MGIFLKSPQHSPGLEVEGRTDGVVGAELGLAVDAELLAEA